MSDRPPIIDPRPLSLCLFGAAPDTHNMGVTALCHATLQGLRARLPNAQFTVFDHGHGVRETVWKEDGDEIHMKRIGSVVGMRLHRPENLYRWRLSHALALMGPPGLQAIRECDAVLDLSLGDSFTDLYGMKRFRQVSLQKQIAIDCERPLILLPQTYGPFRQDRARKLAASQVRHATMAWARDERSFDVLKSLLAEAFRPERHRCGVDLAFGLRPQSASLPLPLAGWFQETETPVVGLNVSGLLFYNEDFAERNGFRANYKESVLRLLRLLLNKGHAYVVLTPHVLSEPGHYESDRGACDWLRDQLSPEEKIRTFTLPTHFNQGQLKGIIAQFDWFCGTRMHSTIASLSSGVPCAAIAYSDKTAGVFAGCGLGECVADPRESETDALVEQVFACFETRSHWKTVLQEHLTPLLEQHAAQLNDIATCISRESSS